MRAWCFVGLLFVAAVRPAEAYLDVSTGSFLAQLLVGGFAGVAVVLRILWQRLRQRPQGPDDTQ